MGIRYHGTGTWGARRVTLVLVHGSSLSSVAVATSVLRMQSYLVQPLGMEKAGATPPRRYISWWAPLLHAGRGPGRRGLNRISPRGAQGLPFGRELGEMGGFGCRWKKDEIPFVADLGPKGPMPTAARPDKQVTSAIGSGLSTFTSPPP
ncbi:hypothetical protein PCL_07611 [Purpureocillium lilacinum]|uniref:Uncharacterized protein n=2 Tax=Purpureocillium lilacinum TaxID=33203 RepID=A0A2U3EIG0_PURLI|nr:hypothetical protein Purlil1_8421 [Purpureocillium lilacinum]PWI74297.1 hypothetical protein PCL_07611 [Purpureocillium lilacinum]